MSKLTEAPTNSITNDSVPQTLELRDIHLPDTISWWPIAPGWWIVLASLLAFFIIVFVIKKIYVSKQLKRDINAELSLIKQQFQTTQNKSQLAKSLSALLRRTGISYYPKANIAGLTGNDWLIYLDKTNTDKSKNTKFQSDIGQILLSAPYLPNDTKLKFDEAALIELCESWLLSRHKPTHKKTKQVQAS